MKYLKMLGLAAVAAAGLMAFVGAGSASAKDLCTENVSPCPAGKTITTIHATQTGTGKLENTAGTITYVTCSESTIHISDITTVGAVNRGLITAWTFGGCSPATPHVTTFGTLSLDASDNAVGEGTEVTITLFAGETCVYGAPAGGLALGTVTTGANATLNINSLPEFKSGGGLCPRSVRWTATFQITNHTSVFGV